MGRVAIFTLGCKVNQAECEELALALVEAGHEVVREPGLADLCVVNTCTVTAESDRKCRKLVRRLARDGARRIAVAGCLVQVHPQAVRDLPGVALMLDNGMKEGWLEHVESLIPPADEGERRRPSLRSRAFVKVQDGCERGCSYCIVPRARGAERSRPPREVMETALRRLEEGCRELVLCGVNLGRYRWGDGYDLASLVSDLLGLADGLRVRLSSIELEDLQERWLLAWSGENRVCPHLHLPLQSGDEGILREMGRGYGPGDFLAVAEMMRDCWPHAALTSEVIVGYPGESETAFARTVDVLRRAGVSRLHVFRFSPRPGTRDWQRRGEADREAAGRRSAALRRLAESWRLGYIERHTGERRTMLVERVSPRGGEGVVLGTTEDYIKAVMPCSSPDISPGMLLEVRIEGVRGARAEVSAVMGGARSG
ncbi:MAG: MiaB/RimO family radical SAM methylthiotransferase [Actinobacteria bacterium]|nr:MiaB/RimO family radical SAM methylthiotransferase [Actinomycetota bacterium]